MDWTQKGKVSNYFGLWCKKVAICNGLIVKESKDKYLEQDFRLLAIKSSFVDYKRNIFENINQIKVFSFLLKIF